MDYGLYGQIAYWLCRCRSVAGETWGSPTLSQEAPLAACAEPASQLKICKVQLLAHERARPMMRGGPGEVLERVC